MRQESTLTGKTVIITGVTRGIGRATAEWFALQGARVVLIARNEVALRKVRDEIRNATGNSNLEYMVVDLSNLEQTHAAVERLLQGYPTIDVVINNAGVLKAATPFTHEGYLVTQATNLLAVALFTKLTQNMPAGGRFIVLGSSGEKTSLYRPSWMIGTPQVRLAQRSRWSLLDYTRSKLAVHALVNYLAFHGRRDIRYLTVEPGMVATDLFRAGGVQLRIMQYFAKHQPPVRQAVEVIWVAATDQSIQSGEYLGPTRAGQVVKKVSAPLAIHPAFQQEVVRAVREATGLSFEITPMHL